MATAGPAPIYGNTQYTAAAADSTKSTTKRKEELGKDDFLKLLITQLKYQDPLNPMKDTEFIAQLATFSSLEQSRNTAKSVEEASAVGMIGKIITDKSNDFGIPGKVTIDEKGTHLTLKLLEKDKYGNILLDDKGNAVYQYEKDEKGNVKVDGSGNKTIVTKDIDYSDIKEIKNSVN